MKQNNNNLPALFCEIAQNPLRGIKSRKPALRAPRRKNGKYLPCPRCRACGKALYDAKENAQAIARRADRKLWIYKCPHLHGWHLTSRCPQCKCREVFHNEGQAKVAKVRAALEDRNDTAAANICPCKCGHMKLCHSRA